MRQRLYQQPLDETRQPQFHVGTRVQTGGETYKEQRETIDLRMAQLYP